MQFISFPKKNIDAHGVSGGTELVCLLPYCFKAFKIFILLSIKILNNVVWCLILFMNSWKMHSCVMFRQQKTTVLPAGAWLQF